MKQNIHIQIHDTEANKTINDQKLVFNLFLNRVEGFSLITKAKFTLLVIFPIPFR